MSERMIELQRAKLGLPPAGASPSISIHNATQSSRSGSQLASTPVNVPTPQQAAAATMLSEDALMQRFLHRLQRRDDSHPVADSNCGPTVPTALSRRILHRQGVGYLDDTVAAITSASADRFLATVLQQAVSCRSQRLQGAEMEREAARQRKRHMQHYKADSDDRKRRREEIEAAREKEYLSAIAAAEALRKGGGAAKDFDDKKGKKKKKVDEEEPQINGKKPDVTNEEEDDDDESYDSLDEEEEYYQNELGEIRGKIRGPDYEDDDTLLLRDLVRPLEAWDFHLTGKEALEPNKDDSDDDSDEDSMDEKSEKATQKSEENGIDDGLFSDGIDGDKFDSRKDDDGESLTGSTRRKAASSPAPNAS